MRTQYQIGSAFEYRLIKKLEDVGYYCVRSSGSHGLVDVVAIGMNQCRLIQCKITKKDNASLTELLKGDNIIQFESLDVPINFFKWLVIKQGRSNELLTLFYNDVTTKWISGIFFK